MLLRSLVLVVLAGGAAALPSMCDIVRGRLPGNLCQCTSVRFGFVLQCSVNFFNQDSIGVKAQFSPCETPASASVSITDTRFHINQQLAGIQAGRQIAWPLPGVSLSIPDVGDVGIDLIVDLEGSLSNLGLMLGVDGCITIVGERRCGRNLPQIGDKLPIKLIQGNFHFNDVCNKSALAAEALYLSQGNYTTNLTWAESH